MPDLQNSDPGGNVFSTASSQLEIICLVPAERGMILARKIPRLRVGFVSGRRFSSQ
jgi:hypothetical protein